MATGALSIKLKCASWQQLATIYKRDLMRGAMFLKASTPPAIGTQVRIDLTLPSNSVIVLTGTVEQHVTDPQRGSGVELKLAPIPAGSIWMIESALAAESGRRRAQPPASGVPATPLPPTQSGPVAAIGAGEDLSAAEADLVRALVAEAESLKKLNPFLVLGIGYEAGDNDVRAAFGELTKRYHPDRFARYESTELRNVAAEIFILIRDAYRRICDEGSRAQVLASLGRGGGAPRAIPSPAMMRTPPGGLQRISPAKPSGQIPPVTRVPERTTPMPIQTSSPTARMQEQTTKKPEPLPARHEGNDNTTKKPEPLNAEKRATGTPPPPVRSVTASPSPIAESSEHGALEEMLDQARYDEALSAYRLLSKKHPNDRTLRAGIELCEGLAALAQRDRLEAAQRFEAALEIDPSNERAARELAEMRRQATNERKGLLSRLMGKKE
jgi:tetratricopeptide (TPR) repeat protein